MINQKTGAKLQKNLKKGGKSMKMLHRGEKGFTLIELLVVIAILGVIAAVVALNVTGFFGRGTLQAANTELHQAQTAIVAAMADAETGTINGTGALYWAGQNGTIICYSANGTGYDASDYCYGPFRALYTVQLDGEITWGNSTITNGWGNSIIWDDAFMNWKKNP
jgi:prepilin-type N-terminal cleavage/methylation domain-containing protein